MDSATSPGAAEELQLAHLQACIAAQQALLAQLRDSSMKQQAIQQLRSLTTDFNSTLDSLETSFRLLDLPRELRNAIYRLCIGHGKIFLPNSFEYDVRYRDRKDYDEPQWQLLAINKQIRAEAMETLFMDNQIIFSEAQGQKLLSNWTPNRIRMDHTERNVAIPAPQLSLSNYSRKLLTSISLALDSRSQVTGLDDRVHWAIFSNRNKEQAARLQIEEHDETLQAHARIVNFDAWQSIDLVQMVFLSPKLRYLELDMTHSYCDLGCCSRADVAGQIMMRIHDTFLQSLPALESINIAGIKTKSEQQRVIDMVGRHNPWLRLIERDRQNCKGAVRNLAGHEIKLCLKGFDSGAHHRNGGMDFRHMNPERADWTVPERTFAFLPKKEKVCHERQ